MTIKDFIEKYKGEVTFNITKSNADGELTDLVSFDTKELEAIKEDITSKEVYKWSVSFANSKATITLIVKESVTVNPPTTDPTEETPPSENTEAGSTEGSQEQG